MQIFRNKRPQLVLTAAETFRWREEREGGVFRMEVRQKGRDLSLTLMNDVGWCPTVDIYGPHDVLLDAVYAEKPLSVPHNADEHPTRD